MKNFFKPPKPEIHPSLMTPDERDRFRQRRRAYLKRKLLAEMIGVFLLIVMMYEIEVSGELHLINVDTEDENATEIVQEAETENIEAVDPDDFGEEEPKEKKAEDSIKNESNYSENNIDEVKSVIKKLLCLIL